MSEPDDGDAIERAASNFVDRYGARAADEARQRACELDEAGDQESRGVWLRIAESVERMLQRRR